MASDELSDGRDRVSSDAHARELETLSNVSRSLMLSSDLEQLGNEILQWTQAFIPGAVGRLWANSDDGTGRTLIASIGLRHGRGVKALKQGQGLGGRAMIDAKTLVSDDVLEDPRFMRKDWARSEGLVSAIMLPLVHRERVYGNLSVFTRACHRFSTDEIRLLEAFAAQVAAVLSNAALYRDSVQKTQQLESLNRISASVAGTLGRHDTLQLIVDEAPKLLRLDGAALRLLENDQLVLACESGLSGYPAILRTVPVGVSLSGHVAQARRVIAVENLEQDEIVPPKQKEALLAQGVRCGIGVPVMNDDQLLGVLVAVGRERRRFKEDDIALLSSFADHVAIAIENNRLYDAVQRELGERHKVEQSLRDHQERLEELVAERTASLEEAQEQLVASERLAALGQLMGSVSHELRTPLGTIRTSLHTLEKRMRGGAQPSQRTLDRAMRNIERCDRIISELLDFTGDVVLRRTEVELGPWLKRVLDEQIVPQPLVLERVLEDGIEASIDEERFRRVVVNVVENAVHAMSDRGLGEQQATDGAIRVALRAQPERIVIEVEDDGPGIPADIMARIFEPLFTTKGFGMGLGLCIVRDIMQRHGGDIEIHSEPGQGTRVELWLPAAS